MTDGFECAGNHKALQALMQSVGVSHAQLTDGKTPDQIADVQSAVETLRDTMLQQGRLDPGIEPFVLQKTALRALDQTGDAQLAAKLAVETFAGSVGVSAGNTLLGGEGNDPLTSESDDIVQVAGAAGDIVKAIIRAIKGKKAERKGLPKGVGSINDLRLSATTPGPNGVSPIARHIEKHGARPGSAFSRLTGNQTKKNQTANDFVNETLLHPGTIFITRPTTRFGNVLDIVGPNGRGMRFGLDGKLIGILEPKR